MTNPPTDTAPPATKRRAVDWDAVERDYRTTKLTDGELSDKHKVTREAIVRRRNKEITADSSRWQRDLTKEVRDATNALLLRETITSQVTEGHRQITDAVISAAEVNKSVILGHRKRLVDLAADADAAKGKLLELGAKVTDVREAAVLVGAIESLSRITKTVIEKERQAFGLEDTAPNNPLESMSDAELQAERARLAGEAG